MWIKLKTFFIKSKIVNFILWCTSFYGVLRVTLAYGQVRGCFLELEGILMRGTSV